MILGERLPLARTSALVLIRKQKNQTYFADLQIVSSLRLLRCFGTLSPVQPF